MTGVDTVFRDMTTWAERHPRWLPYIAISTVHLVLLAGDHPVTRWTQMLLMPALIWPAARVRSPLRAWVLLAVALSWVGDSAPRLVVDEQSRFMTMVGAFLLAQLAWVCGLGNRWSLTLPALRPATTALYAVAAIAIVGFCVPFAGALAPALILFALALTAVAILAGSMGERGIWGGVLFMVSDGLIALDSFITHFEFGGLPVLIMFTYLVGQGLLVGGAASIRDPRNPRRGDTAAPKWAATT